MKSFVTILVAASFIGMAVFGFLGMNHVNGQDHDNGCVTAPIRGIFCPKELASINFVFFHLDVFKGFSLATFGKNILNTILFALASLLLIGLNFFLVSLFKPPQLILSKRRFGTRNFLHQKQELASWLALHENSPSIY